MLVLVRQKDEKIMIGEKVVITVIEVRGNKVRLGIDAPRDIPIHRREVWLQIQAERAESTEPFEGHAADRYGNHNFDLD